MAQNLRAPDLVRTALAVVFLTLIVLAGPVAAQYGGISGLFVITSPDKPGLADFNGTGCDGGDEVVLYLPGIAATPSDPDATTIVEGRILAVTTAFSDAEPVLQGSFLFSDVVLPTDLEPGFYQFHARCGDLDLNVVLELTSDGVRIVTPEEYIDRIRNVPETIPLTGRESSELLSLAALLVTAGLLFAAAGRRGEHSRSRG